MSKSVVAAHRRAALVATAMAFCLTSLPTSSEGGGQTGRVTASPYSGQFSIEAINLNGLSPAGSENSCPSTMIMSSVAPAGVAGYASESATVTPWSWTANAAKAQQVTTGSTRAWPGGVNSSGDMTGEMEFSSSFEGYFVHGSSATPLPDLDGSFRDQGFAINNADQIAGFAYDGTADRAVIWSKASVRTNLGAAVPNIKEPNSHNSIEAESQAQAINSSGDVAGQAQTGSDTNHIHYEPVVWIAGSPTFLPSESSWDYVTAESLTDNDQALFLVDALSGERAFTWSLSKPTEKAVTAAPDGALPASMNASGEMVGTGCVTGTATPWVWIKGSIVNVNDLLPSGSKWTLETADAVNDAGQIVGYGELDGKQTPYILTPEACPKCVSACSVSTGSPAAVLERRMRSAGSGQNDLIVVPQPGATYGVQSDRAVIYSNFPTQDAAQIRTLTEMLEAEQFKVDVYESTTQDAGTATIKNFISAANAGVFIFSTHGFAGKAFRGLLIEQYGNIKAGEAAFESYKDTPYAKYLDGTVYTPSLFDTREAYGIFMNADGIAHFFGGSKPDQIVFGGACYSGLFAADFGADAYYGYSNVVTNDQNFSDWDNLFKRLSGDIVDHKQARNTVAAWNDGDNGVGSSIPGSWTDTRTVQFLYKSPNLNRAYTLSPAVTHPKYVGKPIIKGSSRAYEMEIDFDTVMDSSVPAKSLMRPGEGVSVSDAKWVTVKEVGSESSSQRNDLTCTAKQVCQEELRFRVQAQKCADGCKVNVTILATQAVADAGFKNQLDGNQDPSERPWGRAPNGDNYVVTIYLPKS